MFCTAQITDQAGDEIYGSESSGLSSATPPLDIELTSPHGFLAEFVRRTMPVTLSRFVSVSDIVQSIWLRVQGNRNRVQDFNCLQYRGWVLCIARRKIVDSLRHYRLTESTRHRDCDRLPSSSKFNAISSEPSPIYLVALHEEADRLLAVLEDLPSEVQQIVTLRYSDNLTFPQIAQRLNISTTTCRRRWLEGCEIIRNKLGDVL